MLRSNNPHHKIFVAAFDGTGNDRAQDPDHKSNVARLDEQLTELGNEHIHSHYLRGPGTQVNPLARSAPFTNTLQYESNSILSGLQSTA